MGITMWKLIVMQLSLVYAIVYASLADIPRACSTPETMFPFCNTTLTLDERLDDLIGRLKLTEKPAMLTARASPKGGVPRLGIPEYDWGANCIHGVESRCGTKCPTSFPCPNSLGSSFNESMWKSMASVIGIELRSLWLQGVGEFHYGTPHIGLDCWSPNINIARSPEWGRNMETPGEDPYLTGRFGVQITKGLQEGSLDPRFMQAVVTLKHWAAYSLEKFGNATRHNYDAKVSDFDLQDTYFPAWKASVMDGGAAGVMCSYNALNGVPTCASSFLNKTLRGDWGFNGYVTSDSGAVNDIWVHHHYTDTPWQAAAKAIKDGGCDIDSGEVYEYGLYEALLFGEVHESDIDDALRRSLAIRFRLGLFDPIDDQPYWHVSPDVVSTQQSRDMSLQASKEGMILLKNDNKTLPLSPGVTLAIIGPHAEAQAILAGNYIGQLCPGSDPQAVDCIETPLDALTRHNQGGKTVYAQGCKVTGDDKSGIDEAVTVAQGSDVIILMLGIDLNVEREGADRTSISLTGVQPDLVTAIMSTGKPIIVVLFNGGIVTLDDDSGKADAIIEAFYPGVYGSEALASIVFGDYSPAGRLPVTLYHEDYIHQENFLSMDMTVPPGRTYRYFTGNVTYPFGWGLSYTEFTLEWEHHDDHITIVDVVTYTCKVTNVGKVKGDEVVLAFYVPSQDTLSTPVPIKRLFGFKRVTLEPQESTTVSFNLTPYDIGLVDPSGNRLFVPSEASVMLSNGVANQITAPLHIKGDMDVL